MRYLIALVGVLIVAISGVGIVVPAHLIAIVSGWPTNTRLYVAVGTRLVLGLVFIAGAPTCRWPAVIYAVGIMALAASVVLMLLGGARLDAFIQWWSQQPSWFVRAWCVAGALLGALVLYSALGHRQSPPTRSR